MAMMMMVGWWWWYVQDTEVKVKLLRKENEKTCVHNMLVIVRTGVLQQQKTTCTSSSPLSSFCMTVSSSWSSEGIFWAKERENQKVMQCISLSHPIFSLAAYYTQKAYITFSLVFAKSKIAREREKYRKKKEGTKPFSCAVCLNRLGYKRGRLHL